MHSLAMERRGLLVELAQATHLLLKGLAILPTGVQPATMAMGMQVGLILKNAPSAGGKSRRQYPVGQLRRPVRVPSND